MKSGNENARNLATDESNMHIGGVKILEQLGPTALAAGPKVVCSDTFNQSINHLFESGSGRSPLKQTGQTGKK